MRALPILAALLCTAPFAKASTTELDLLQSRCQEQERQIRQLEEENSRLKSLVTTATKTPAPAQAATPAATETKQAEEAPKATSSKSSKTTDNASYGIVRAGDTLNKLAKRHRTSPEALAELNNLKKPFMIRAGQRMRLPDTKPAAVAKAEAPKSAPSSEVTEVAKASSNEKTSKAATPRTGTHTVKSGETFFSIARHYGMSANALQAANPEVKPINLRIGQTLQLGAKPAATATTKSTPAKSANTSASKSESKPEVASSKPSESSNKQPAAETTAKATAPAPETSASEPAPSPAAAEQPAANSNGSRVRTVAIEETTPLSSFAAAHGTSIARLNALNGLNLNSSTVLAKGSELYVPAQP